MLLEGLVLPPAVQAPANVPPDGPAAPGGAVPPLDVVADAVGGVQHGAVPVLLRGQVVEHVDHFVYLGSVVTADNSLDRDVSRRLSRAAYAFQTLQPVLRNRHLSARTKCTLHRVIVVNNLRPGWYTAAKRGLSRPPRCAACQMSSISMRCLRRILGISRLDHWWHVTNRAIPQKAMTDSI